MSRWALIPARGGSKGIPRKNLRTIAGTSLLERAILNAQSSKQFERVTVSSEDEEILTLARALGADIHERNMALAQDDTPTEAVFRNYLESFEQPNRPELICCCECTSPFIEATHFQSVIESLLLHPKIDTCMTICEVDHTSHAYNQRFINNEELNFILPFQRVGTRRQTKPKFFKFGNLVIARSQHILNGGSFFSGRVGYVEIPKIYSINIDEEEDIILAEAVARQYFLENSYS